MNMELIDTPNPNAKKLLASHSYEIGEYLDSENLHRNSFESNRLALPLQSPTPTIHTSLFS